jgi:site-specific DNA recombinase
MISSKVAIYARVSTEEQAEEGYSIQGQLETLRQYASMNNWKIVDEYVDEGISGKTIEARPELQRMLHDASKGRFNIVLVWKISRLSRNLYNTLGLFQYFEENNIQFISYSENFDTSNPIGKLAMQIMGSVSEMERNTLAENVKMGMKQKAMQGGWNGGVVLGYDSLDGKLHVNEQEATIVCRIFNEYCSGKGLRAISNQLNKEGFRTKRKRHFSINSISQILDNPIYVGKISWNKLENWSEKRRKGTNPNPILVAGMHEPIISEELWNTAKERRKSKSFKQRASHEPFLLNSIIRCPECGHGMVPGISTTKLKSGEVRKHRYYVCGQFHNKGTTACHANSVRAYDAEEDVINIITNLVNQGELLDELVNTINQERINNIEPLQREQHILQSNLKELKGLQKRYFEAFEKQSLPLDMLQERMQALSEDKIKIEEQLQQIAIELRSSEQDPVPVGPLRNLLSIFLSLYHRSEREKQKWLLQLLIKDISVNNDEQPRRISKATLLFDFMDISKSPSFILLNELTTDINSAPELPTWQRGSHINHKIDLKKIPDHLKEYLPLFMVRFTSIDPKRSVYLL